MGIDKSRRQRPSRFARCVSDLYGSVVATCNRFAARWGAKRNIKKRQAAVREWIVIRQVVRIYFDGALLWRSEMILPMRYVNHSRARAAVRNRLRLPIERQPEPPVFRSNRSQWELVTYDLGSLLETRAYYRIGRKGKISCV